MLERAKWAAEVFQRYDRDRTYAIAEAVAREAHAKAATYAEWAVRETGFGVAEHKKLKNELTSLPFLEYYRDWDFVGPHTRCGEARRRNPAAGGSDLRADPVNQPDLDAQFQNPLRAAHAQCDRDVAASGCPRMLRRCRAASCERPRSRSERPTVSFRSSKSRISH